MAKYFLFVTDSINPSPAKPLGYYENNGSYPKEAMAKSNLRGHYKLAEVGTCLVVVLQQSAGQLKRLNNQCVENVKCKA